MKKVRFNIIQYIKIKWECPNCYKFNYKTIYSSDFENIQLQCDYCGENFIGE